MYGAYIEMSHLIVRSGILNGDSPVDGVIPAQPPPPSFG